MSLPALLLPRRKVVRKPLWGGEALARWLALEGEAIGETWEVFDRDGESSAFENAGLEGVTLADLVRTQMRALLGGARPDRLGRFPLLLKLLDARERLSLQVHPDAELAGTLGIADNPKSEAWVILRATPGAKLIRGLRPGVSGRELMAAIEAGRDPLPMVQELTVTPGDVIDVPAGTVHCIGPGIVLYEIQENSDVTLRLSDWGRVEPGGKSRPLHPKEGRLAIHDAWSPSRVTPALHEGVERLIANSVFDLRRLRLTARRTLGTGGVCQILTVIEGLAELTALNERVTLRAGATCLVPASVDEFMFDAGGGHGAVILLASPAVSE
jgi:mannose-6-phosphate isomerase